MKRDRSCEHIYWALCLTNNYNNMKKLILLLYLLFYAVCISAQTNYYYNRGVYWAEGAGNNPFWMERAYKEWKNGEQKGEKSCARMVIGCLLFGKGVPQNVQAAINMINKWYTKDQWTCLLGAALYLPKKYGFVPYDGLWKYDFINRLSIYSNSYRINLEDFGKATDIAKALSYAKHSKIHFKNASTYDGIETYDLFLAIEGICYKYGLCGYNKSLIQAAKRMNYVVDVDGVHDYSPMYELIKNSSSLEELYDNMVQTSKDIASHPSHNMDYLITLAASEGSTKPVRDNYINTFLFRVDEFINEFWKLSVDERVKIYNESDEKIKQIYDNSFYYRAYSQYQQTQIGPNEITQISNIIKDYPGGHVVEVVKNAYANRVISELNKIEANDYNSYLANIRIINHLAEAGIIDGISQYHLANIKSKLLHELHNLEDVLKKDWEHYEKSRLVNMGLATFNDDGLYQLYGGEMKKYDPTFYRNSNNLASIVNSFKEVFKEGEGIREFGQIEQFANQALAFARVLGFYEISGRIEYQESESKIYKWYMEKYPNTPFQKYAELIYSIKVQEENDENAFTQAYSLRLTSSKDDINKILLLPMSENMQILIKEMCKRKFIKTHETYIENKKDKVFLNCIINLLHEATRTYRKKPFEWYAKHWESYLK